MYKLLLCWRYLLTRYIALISIVSVMLGVAVMIVVNAVMLGFATEMQNRIHGVLADVIFQARDLNKGFPDYPWHRKQILDVAGNMIEELTPTIIVPGMITYRFGGTGEPMSMPVDIVGIDSATQGKVSDIARYLQHPANRKQLSFALQEDGYDIADPKIDNAAHRFELGYAGWKYRRQVTQSLSPVENQPPTNGAPVNPFDTLTAAAPATVFDPSKEQHAGTIIGIGLSLYHREQLPDEKAGKKIIVDKLALIPGDDVMLTFPTSDLKMQFQSDSFTVTDLYESKMVDYDKKLVFVPIEKLQQLRGMYEDETGRPTVTQILIKAKPGVDLDKLRDKLQSFFPAQLFSISTWRDEQKSLLEAVFIEQSMLNVLLFLIFAVAGFGILGIFYMIVSEKKKDVGILKSLGAGSGGIMQIFLMYSLLLGVVGCGLGLVLGLLIVQYIKEIAWVLSKILGTEVFSPEIYSFYEIPTAVNVWTVSGIIAGAVLIAVLSGILPALRAARLNPVETLRS